MAPKPGGISQFWSPEGLVEVHTSTCAHCQHITDIPSKRKMFEYVDICRQCMKLICLHCADKPCTPWIKQVEEAEEREYRRRQMGV